MQIEAFCKARIFNVVDRNAQVNILRAHSRAAFDNAEEDLYDELNKWTDDTIAKCRELVAENNPNYEDESLWPPISEAAIAFAKRY